MEKENIIEDENDINTQSTTTIVQVESDSGIKVSLDKDDIFALNDANIESEDEEIISLEEEAKSSQTKDDQSTLMNSNTKAKSSTLGRKIRSYTHKFKLEVFNFVMKNSIKEGMKKFSIDRKTIAEWILKIDQIKHEIDIGRGNKKRLIGGGRPTIHTNIEELLADWIDEQRGKKLPVTRRMVIQQANEYTKQLKMDSFFTMEKNHSWLDRFLQRHNFALRDKTTTCQKIPESFGKDIARFIVNISNLRKKLNPLIVGCDETSIWLESVGATTIERKGAREVAVLTCGMEKVRYTLMLSARSDGIKLKPFLLINRKRPIKELKRFESDINIVYEGTNWMNDETTKIYLNKLKEEITDFSSFLLIWDSFKSHTSLLTRELCSQLNINTMIIPPGCTKFVQPADVCWNKPFKDKFRIKYEDWMSERAKKKEEMEKEDDGIYNDKPGFIQLCQWVNFAWESLSTELIEKSFKICGFTSDVNGSDDDDLHFFKHNPELKESLKKERRKFEKKEYNEKIKKIQQKEIKESEKIQKAHQNENVKDKDSDKDLSNYKENEIINLINEPDDDIIQNNPVQSTSKKDVCETEQDQIDINETLIDFFDGENDHLNMMDIYSKHSSPKDNRKRKENFHKDFNDQISSQSKKVKANDDKPKEYICHLCGKICSRGIALKNHSIACIKKVKFNMND